MSPTALAPIAIFVFKRPEDTRRLLESLCANPEWLSSEVWVFCEGARGPADQAEVDATRAVLRERDWHPKLRLIEHAQNQGCAKSILDGVARVLAEHDTVIVLEDDLEVAPAFLAYMNEGLRRYLAVEDVMQVAAYTYPVDTHSSDDAFFLPFPNPWGWGTWRRAWTHMNRDLSNVQWLRRLPWRRWVFDMRGAYGYSEMLEQAQRQEIDAWDIYWYLAMFRRGGLAIYPAESLVANHGLSGGGTHQGDIRLAAELSTLSVARWPQSVHPNRACMRSIRGLLRGAR